MCYGKQTSASVLCMDVGFSMSNSGPGEEPPFELAKKVIQKFVQRQVFAESKDELALVLFGTDATKNPLHRDGQYQNITVHRHLMMPDFELLEEIENQIHPENHQADCILLFVCMKATSNLLLLIITGQKPSKKLPVTLSPFILVVTVNRLVIGISSFRGKKYDRLNIALLTDLNTQASADNLEIIIENLKQVGITLQFFLPFTLEDNEEGGADPDRRGSDHPGTGKGLSREQKSGLDMVKHILLSLDEGEGLDEVYSFRNALEQLYMFKRIERRPMAWPCQLTIGSSLSIRIVGYKAVTEEKLKKSWITVDAQTAEKEDIKRETVYCLDDDNETEVQKDDTIQGFRYGSDIVPFSKVDQEQMKYKHDGKCFAVLGFAKQNLVHRHQFMGNQVVKIFAPSDDEHAGVALSALIRALDELKMLAIVRYAYDRRSNPQVGAAFPCIKRDYECLLYVQLPFTEDLRQFTFPSLDNKKLIPSDAQLSAVDSLIDSMMLVEQDENGEQKDMLKVHHIPNPAFQRHFQCLHHRAVSPGTPLPPIEPWLKAALEPPEVISERCRGSLHETKRKFPLIEVEKKKKLKTSAQIFGKDSEELDAKKAKAAEDEEYNLADIAEGSVTSLENADLYNSYLQSLKRSIPNRGLEVFWDLLVQDSITLINSDEVEGSTVSKNEANQFLVAEEKKEETSAPPAEDTGDVDDLVSVYVDVFCVSSRF
ncbi:X-ray repair cross-complementing protein 5 [Channa argus]|uniref:X-ray repair cross-complementing protein 5 n=1 Tax=Channa argus TaxID=215402 RepID=A0A6G1PXF4_CHAAH|nr:X-ray repair cross-complementing protein 5 [Channa argus]